MHIYVGFILSQALFTLHTFLSFFTGARYTIIFGIYKRCGKFNGRFPKR